jgi:hypothetical protein
MTLTLLDPPPDEPDHDALTTPDGFPAPPAAPAYHGLAGQIVTTIAPHTEADPVAILGQLLVAFGAAVGRRAYFSVEATQHHPNEFLVLVGDSAKGPQGLLLGPRPPPPRPRRPDPRRQNAHRPVVGRGTDLGRPRPHTH